MTQEEIFEYNKRCAEFLGFKYRNQSKFWAKYPLDNNSFLSKKGYMRMDTLQFHSDWNWIMPVVEKIESLGTGYVMMENNKCEIVITLDNQGKKHFSNRFIQNTKLESIYEGVIEFIKWYNENK